jgi:pilus assembly protein Flp/PilA
MLNYTGIQGVDREWSGGVVMTVWGALRRSERGATAIEYAIIGALIGIGLVGSLIGTKTSLNAVFGVASSQMASGTKSGTSMVVPPSANAGAWAARTLTSTTVTAQSATGKTIRYTFADGTIVDYSETFDGTGAFTGDSFVQVNGSTIIHASFDPTGNQTYWQKDIMNGSNPKNQYWGYSSEACGGGNWCGSYANYHTDSYGVLYRDSAGNYTVAASILAGTYNDGLYFRGLSNS